MGVFLLLVSILLFFFGIFRTRFSMGLIAVAVFGGTIAFLHFFGQARTTVAGIQVVVLYILGLLLLIWLLVREQKKVKREK